jgi:hypothetical protein
MKTRITNVLTATLWLLLIAVWLPTFWALAQLPGTWDGDKPSALLSYVFYELDTVYYRIDDPNKSRDCDPNPKSGGKYSKLFDDDFVWPPLKPCGKPLKKTLSTGISDWFIPFVVFTLLVLGGQYMLTGGLTLRLVKEKEDTKT